MAERSEAKKREAKLRVKLSRIEFSFSSLTTDWSFFPRGLANKEKVHIFCDSFYFWHNRLTDSVL
jgi:hypothetical protein